jgi:hypothetical protein
MQKPQTRGIDGLATPGKAAGVCGVPNIPHGTCNKVVQQALCVLVLTVVLAGSKSSDGRCDAPLTSCFPLPCSKPLVTLHILRDTTVATP